MRSFRMFTLNALIAGSLALASSAYGHATYNLSGYGSGLGGSTNGVDGAPAGLTAMWTGGPVGDYVGALPVNWYCGLHNPTQVRTIQTGLDPNPPASSLLAEVNTHNAETDPDLPTDAVLAVRGLSWSDPSNGDQGWGHGLDYGLIHLSPFDTTGVLANGPVKLTITLTDDPTDDVAVRLAYALYGGWDTSASIERHQTFITSPSPVDNPLGSAGLKFIGAAVASTAGATLSKTFDVDLTYGGKYTVFVGALGGVPGQYQVTAGLFPAGTALEELEQCQTTLADAEATLASMTSDGDADGVPDERDGCGGTPAGQFVDEAGCSQAQFCAGFPVTTKNERKVCKLADWKNDEASMKPKQADCAFVKSTRTCDAHSD